MPVLCGFRDKTIKKIVIDPSPAGQGKIIQFRAPAAWLNAMGWSSRLVALASHQGRKRLGGSRTSGFDNIRRVNALTDAGRQTLRISIDTKATVHVGDYLISRSVTWRFATKIMATRSASPTGVTADAPLDVVCLQSEHHVDFMSVIDSIMQKAELYLERLDARRRQCLRCAPALAWKSPANPSAWLASSRRGISRLRFRPGKSRRRWPRSSAAAAFPPACSTRSWAGAV